jgi:hypothetical protein
MDRRRLYGIEKPKLNHNINFRSALMRTTTIPVLVLALAITGISTTFGQDLLMEIRTSEAGEVAASFTPEKGLDMGEIKSSDKRDYKISFKNSLKKDLEFGSIRSPCVCIDIDGAPGRLSSGEETIFKLHLDGESYRGLFNKFMHVRLKTANSENDIFLPVKFTIIDEDDNISPLQPETSENGPIRFSDYNGGGFEKYAEAKAWIFAGKDCPGCNFLKRELLPGLLAKDGIERAEAVMVDLDKKENFIFLSELEEKLNAKGDKTPALYWKGRLIYGNQEIKKLIAVE